MSPQRIGVNTSRA